MPDAIPPPLNDDRIALIEVSFTRALRSKAELAARVYDRFFQLEPAARPLFQDDLTLQRTKITRALSFTVRAMASEAELLRMAEGLAKSHQQFHLRPDQFQHMADAILGALEDCLGAGFTPDMRSSWQLAFDRLLPMILAAQDRWQPPP